MPKLSIMAVDDVPLPEILQNKRLIDIEQSAKFLGYTVCHLRRLYNSGKIAKPVKIGARKGGYTVEYLLSLVEKKVA